MTEKKLEELWYESAGTRLFAAESAAAPAASTVPAPSGAGRALVLLHGGLANHLSAQLLAPASCRSITPDLRGSGRSIYRARLTWDQLADDVAALLRHRGLDRAVIGGISFGTGCAIRAALRYPELVEALVLLHPVYAGTRQGLTPAQQAAMSAMDAAGTRTLTDGMDALSPLLDTLPEAIRARARATVATYDPASVAASTHFMASGEQPFDEPSELAAITAPTLLVPGIDPTHPREVADLYARHLPCCTVRDVDPPRFASAIAEFIGSDEMR